MVMAALVGGAGAVPLHAQTTLYWNTNGTSAALTANNWGSSGSGPFTTGFTSGDSVDFTATSTITYSTNNLAVGNITVSGNSTVNWYGTAGSVSFSTGGVISTVNIATGSELIWTTQSVSSAAGTGFIKNGGGTWDIVNTMKPSSAPAGFTLNAGTVIASATYGLGSGNLTINGGTLETDATTAYGVGTILTIGGDFALTGAGATTFTQSVGLGSATRTITNNNSGGTTFTGVISGGTGAGLIFAGTGATINLTGTANTFTGNVDIGDGTVNGVEVDISGAGSLGATSNVITIDGGRLGIASGTSMDLSAYSILLGATTGTSISVKGSGTVLTYNGVLADSSTVGILVKQGAGEMKVGGVSTFTGQTYINNGTIQLTTGNNRLPTGTVMTVGQGGTSVNTGSLDLNSNNQQIAGLISGAATAGTLVTTSNSVTSAGAATLTINVAGGQSFTFGSSTATNTGSIGGAVSVVKSGAGLQIFGGTNTTSGTTSVTAGTLQFAKELSLYNDNSGGSSWTATNVTVSSGATLALNVGGTGEFTSADVAAIQVLGSASGGFQGGSSLGLDTTNASGGNFTYGNVIADTNTGNNSIGLVKLGANSLTLTAANTYTGATTINTGTLAVNGSTAAGRAVAVNNTGTLAGTGTVNGAVTVASGGAISAGGATPGQLTLGGNLTLNSGSTLNFRLSGTGSDQIVLNGTGAAGGTVTVNLLDFNGTAAPGLYTLLSVTGTSTWNVSAFSLVAPSEWAGSFLTIGGNGFDLDVDVIPEPATNAAIFGAVALAGAVWLRRRRRAGSDRGT
jgi:autotransporter-associated beta strand protein